MNSVLNGHQMTPKPKTKIDFGYNEVRDAASSKLYAFLQSPKIFNTVVMVIILTSMAYKKMCHKQPESKGMLPQIHSFKESCRYKKNPPSK